MTTLVIHTRKVLVCATIVMLAAALIPGLPVHAQSAAQPGTSPDPGERSGLRLERTWLRQQRQYDRLGFIFDHTQQRIARLQNLIDRAQENGKDITQVQAALDAYAEAVRQARPAFDSAQGILASHKGFDEDGAVEDFDLARATVEAMSESLKEIRDILREPRGNLMGALGQYWKTNRPN